MVGPLGHGDLEAVGGSAQPVGARLCNSLLELEEEIASRPDRTRAVELQAQKPVVSGHRGPGAVPMGSSRDAVTVTRLPALGLESRLGLGLQRIWTPEEGIMMIHAWYSPPHACIKIPDDPGIR